VPAKRTARFRVGRMMKECVDAGTPVPASAELATASEA
jgi:hypothetical protein